MKDYFKTLDISRNATDSEIKTAYRRAAKFYHPDRYNNDPEMKKEAEKRFKEATEAYKVLSDPEKRQVHLNDLHRDEQKHKKRADDKKAKDQHHETKQRFTYYGKTIKKTKKYRVNNTYKNVDQLNVFGLGDLELGTSNDNNIHIHGISKTNPKANSRQLTINTFDGEILLPSELNIRLNISLNVGDVKGQVQHEGLIKTKVGDVNIRMMKPMILDAKTSTGDIYIKSSSEVNAESKTGDIRIRASHEIVNAQTNTGDVDIKKHEGTQQKPRGKLEIKSNTGDIEVKANG